MGEITRHPPADFLPQLVRLAVDGLGLQGIAKAFNARPDTVDRWLDQVPQARAVLESVRTKVPALTGRPQKHPPIDAARRIEEAASEVPRMSTVALAMRVSRDTLRNWLKADPELAQAFEWGKAAFERRCVMRIETRSKDQERPAVDDYFLLKTLCGYREGDQGEQTSRLNITFNLPGAMTREQFERSVVATQEPSGG